MCGFTFILDNRRQLTKDFLDQQIDVLSHRGPDFGSALLKKTENCDLGFIHNRLSIIDLTEGGNQPMETDTSILVFNGEIYNYKELAKEYDLSIVSSSDTEVLIKGLEAFGEDFIDKLNGMFAFCFYNKLTGEIIVARDRLGVKPLYSFQDDERVVFSSEIKGILPFLSPDKIKLNVNEVFNYFRDGCTSINGTLYQDIEKVRPGCFYKFNIDNQKRFIPSRYWEYDKGKPTSIASFQELMKRLEEILSDSIRLRLRSDVPIGIYLSGGYDSSLIASLAADIDPNIQTYSIGLGNQQHDESKLAAQVARKIGVKHTIFTIDERSIDAEILSSLIASLDDPIADPSIIPNFLLNKMANGHIKVALTGDGGDELFAGYTSYLASKRIWLISKTWIAKIIRLITRIRPLRMNRKISRFRSYLGHNDIIDLHKEITSVFNRDYLFDVVFSKRFSDSISISKDKQGGILFKSKLHGLLSHDIESDLPNKLLLKTDRTSMAFGVEARDPLLDFRLFNLASETSFKLFFNRNNGKYPIKALANKRIGRDLLDRPKSGFNIPIKEICGDLFENNKWVFNRDLIKRQGIFSQDYVDYLSENMALNKVNYRHLYAYFIFQLWYNKWFDR